LGSLKRNILNPADITGKVGKVVWGNVALLAAVRKKGS